LRTPKLKAAKRPEGRDVADKVRKAKKFIYLAPREGKSLSVPHHEIGGGDHRKGRSKYLAYGKRGGGGDLCSGEN